MMDDKKGEIVFKYFSEQFRALKEYQSNGFESIARRLDSIEKEIKYIKDKIPNTTGENFQKSENFHMFSQLIKDIKPPNEDVTPKENKENGNFFSMDTDSNFSKCDSNNRIESFEKHIEDLSLQQNEKKKMDNYPFSFNTIKNIDSKLYIKSSDENKPTDIGRVSCSLFFANGGKYLEVMNKSTLVKSTIRLINNNINTIQKKDGKNYVALIFPIGSFDHFEGGKLDEFYLKFSDKENGNKFYKKIKEFCEV
ncbi:Hypothetical protein SRAE_1000199600 [Strongyloides ratti]|uniref:Uncharacterized protein n=1 Tax=Strongyloides ratti TaxID=34506 RepID=A0A090L6M2_STRRB|nr:Hypothetical protein SRAE_1000199600 [Strongyloides ratti]CEF63738.1 Hypothetical protein SRAE_1000199600 [Strongyloides ratti]